jgi:hypothetical protein
MPRLFWASTIAKPGGYLASYISVRDGIQLQKLRNLMRIDLHETIGNISTD